MDTSITAISVNMLQEFQVVSTTKIIVLPRTTILAIGKAKELFYQRRTDMKAPETIFLPIVNMGVEDGECTAPIWWNKDKTAEHSDVVKAIEYIRKDLYDKLKEKYDTLKSYTEHPWDCQMGS